jgi:Nucleotidyl transferase AbiEii toxin, Type IV TA system
MEKAYADTVRLLLPAAPEVFAYNIFAMKGGTAINLFVQDMPCLSADIDVVYTPWQTPRAGATLGMAGAESSSRVGFATSSAARYSRTARAGASPWVQFFGLSGAQGLARLASGLMMLSCAAKPSPPTKPPDIQRRSKSNRHLYHHRPVANDRAYLNAAIKAWN